MDKKYKQSLKRKIPIIERDTSQNESILEEILSISGKSTKPLKESADVADVNKETTDVSAVGIEKEPSNSLAAEIQKQPTDASDAEIKETSDSLAKKIKKEPVDVSAVKIKKEPVDVLPVKIKKEPVDALPVKIKKEPVDALPVKVKKETVDASPVKIKKETVEAPPVKIKKEPNDGGSEKMKPVSGISRMKRESTRVQLARIKKESTNAPPAKLKKEPADVKPKIKKEQVKAPAKIKKEPANKRPRIEKPDPPAEQSNDDDRVYIPLAERPKINDEEVFLQTLPKGWKRKSVVRKSGKTAGQIDVYFYSPEGTKLRSRPEVASYIARHDLDLRIEDFDFSKQIADQEFHTKKEPAPPPKKKIVYLDGSKPNKSVRVKQESSDAPVAMQVKKEPVDESSDMNDSVAEDDGSVVVKILPTMKKKSRK